MRFVRAFFSSALVGALIVLPAYLAVWLLFRGMQTVAAVVHPLAMLMPVWLPAERLLSLIFVLIICVVIGIAMKTRPGASLRGRLEHSVLTKLPGYDLLSSLTQRLAGEGRENEWKPAFAEIEEALVPAFIIEEFADGRFTVFVPSSPTPFAGAVYILTPERVHPIDVPFTTMLLCVSRWGSGAKALVKAMEKRPSIDS